MPPDANRQVTNLPVGRKSPARAVAAERDRHGCDDPDFTGPVCVAVPVRNFANVVGRHGFEWKLFVDPADDLFSRDNLVQVPTVAVPDVHELDEPHDVPAALEVAGETDDIVFVHSALDYAVDLYRAQTGAFCGIDPFEYSFRPVVSASHFLERIWVEAVEAHRDAMQAGVSK